MLQDKRKDSSIFFVFKIKNDTRRKLAITADQLLLCETSYWFFREGINFIFGMTGISTTLIDTILLCKAVKDKGKHILP